MLAEYKLAVSGVIPSALILPAAALESHQRRTIMGYPNPKEPAWVQALFVLVTNFPEDVRITPPLESPTALSLFLLYPCVRNIVALFPHE